MAAEARCPVATRPSSELSTTRQKCRVRFPAIPGRQDALRGTRLALSETATVHTASASLRHLRHPVRPHRGTQRLIHHHLIFLQQSGKVLLLGLFLFHPGPFRQYALTHFLEWKQTRWLMPVDAYQMKAIARSEGAMPMRRLQRKDLLGKGCAEQVGKDRLVHCLDVLFQQARFTDVRRFILLQNLQTLL